MIHHHRIDSAWAAEICDLGAGHTVTALYGVVPVGVDDLKYQRNEEQAEPSAAELTDSPELMTAKLQWKPVGQDESVRREQSVIDFGVTFTALPKA